MYETRSSTTVDVVSIADGVLSASTADTRSSCTPSWGTDSGTATNPAVSAPRKATR
jgi:hypothetical protein